MWKCQVTPLSRLYWQIRIPICIGYIYARMVHFLILIIGNIECQTAIDIKHLISLVSLHGRWIRIDVHLDTEILFKQFTKGSLIALILESRTVSGKSYGVHTRRNTAVIILTLEYDLCTWYGCSGSIGYVTAQCSGREAESVGHIRIIIWNLVSVLAPNHHLILIICSGQCGHVIITVARCRTARSVDICPGRLIVAAQRTTLDNEVGYVGADLLYGPFDLDHIIVRSSCSREWQYLWTA